MKRERIQTVRDAAQDRLDTDNSWQYERPTDPRIGTLCRNGRTVFYAFVCDVYREGSVADLTRELNSN